jgi:hypothetical protein
MKIRYLTDNNQFINFFVSMSNTNVNLKYFLLLNTDWKYQGYKY